MAHLALTLDSDTDRRRIFLAESRQRLETLTGLTAEAMELDNLGIIWACGPRTPKSVSPHSDQLRLLFGYVVDAAGNWLNADSLSTSQAADDPQAVVGDGYFAAVSYARREGLVISVDPLGMFPMYWSCQSGILTVATSAELISAHPLFELTFDRRGLAGILLTNGLLNQRSLFRHIQRLRPGHRLLTSPTGKTCEQQVYELQRDDNLSELPFEEACQLVSQELRRATVRHQPPAAETTLLLSGGMDSRLMAGYLQQNSATHSAVCFGCRYDYEARAASQVGETLDLPVYLDSYESSDTELCAEAMEIARWQHLAGGFGCVHSWTNNNPDYQKPIYFWSGYLLDELIGGVAFTTGRDPDTEKWSFDFFTSRINRWGLAENTLRQLLKIPQSSTMIESLYSDWRAEYERMELRPSQRAFVAKLGSRARFHIGTHLHRLALQSWPLMPMLDRRLLHVLFNLNPQWLLKRRLETELLQRDFPQLAAIPFDTNSFRFFPRYINKGENIPSASLRLRQWLQKSSHRLYWTTWMKTEPRRYHRLYDLNSPQWMPMRALAESQRGMMHDMFDIATFDALLPQPGIKIRFKDPFSQGAPRRTLLGLMLWHAASPAHSNYTGNTLAVA